MGRRSKPHRRTDTPVKHPSRNLHRAAGVRTRQRAAENNVVRLADRLMNRNAMRKPRMPGVQELTKYRPVGVLECCCTTQSALTKASVTARRARFTRKACGYVDDRLRRPAALPPLPKRAWKAGKCSPSPTYPQAPQPAMELILIE